MISVVICAFTMDRWEQLNLAVSSVESQPEQHEIIVVIDHNDSLLRRSRQQWPDHPVLANQLSKGLSGARNTGVMAASGDLVAFLDDDAIADDRWLSELISAFDDPAVGGVGGHVVPMWGVAKPGWLPPEFWWVVGCSYTGLPTEAVEIRNPIGANMAFRRSVFEQIGGFREGIGRVGKIARGCEETELAIRARAAGHTIWYRPSAIVQHLVTAERTTPRYFLRRCLGEGASKAAVGAIAGHDDGLSAERTYVTRTLPRGVGRGCLRAMRGPDRGTAVGQVAAICSGLMVTAIGFVQGALLTSRSLALEPPPGLWRTDRVMDAGAVPVAPDGRPSRGPV